jgi:hypothetical protein
VRRLQGIDPPRHRLRVGRYRVLFTSEPGVIIVERVRDRATFTADGVEPYEAI